MFTHATAQQTAKITSSGIGYLEYLPQGYNSNSNRYPIVISLHGIGEKGTSSNDPALVKESVWKVANVSLARYVKDGKQYPFILISPQLKSSYGTWPADYVMDVINHVKKYLRVDDRRIYLTGLSLGGFGVWKTVGAYPNTFAAIAPICSGGSALSQACAIANSDVPVWTFHGDKDGVVSCQVSIKMVNALNACTPKPSPLAKITIFPGLGHAIWNKVYKETNVLNWMLTFVNGSTAPPTTPENTIPIVDAGSDKTLTLPTTSVALQGSANDPDGTIASYQWTKTSGGEASLGGATSPKLTASGLVAGSYSFRLTVKDNKGASKSDDVTVTVKSSSSNNIAPIAKAGADKTISTTSTSLQGSGTDADGSVAYYKWYKVSGPPSSWYNVSKPTLTIYDLKSGTYVFKLVVTDNKGATGADYVTITVNAGTASIQNDNIKMLATPLNLAPKTNSKLTGIALNGMPYNSVFNNRELFALSVSGERRRMNVKGNTRA